MTQYRLLARAELHGAIRDPGYIFTLADGEKGPHRTVVASNHGAQITDRMNAEEDLVDEPLYVEVQEPVIREKSAAEIRDELEAKVDAARDALLAAEHELAEHDAADGKPLLLEKPQSNLPKKS